MENELKHHGVKGMKWGVRRYQNEDGTLTPAGERRYDTGTASPRAAAAGGPPNNPPKKPYSSPTAKEESFNDLNKRLTKDQKMQMLQDKKVDDQFRKNFGPKEYDIDYSSQINRYTNEAQKVTRGIGDIVDLIPDNKKRMDLSSMSDQELREHIKREYLEREYDDLFNPPTRRQKGKENAKKVLNVAGTLIVVGGSIASIVAPIAARIAKSKAVKKVGKKVVKKAAKKAVKVVT